MSGSGLQQDESPRPVVPDRCAKRIEGEVKPAEDAAPLTGPYEKLNSLCEAFLQEGHPATCFGDYLRRVADDAQPTLLRNLLHLEIVRRREAGEQPNAEEYIQNLPHFATLIRQVFIDSSSALSSGHQETTDPLNHEQAVAERPAANHLGEYRLLRELGHGGMGTVYEAVHTRQGNHVALKTLPRVDGAALHLFKREFRALADVNHPNLVGLHTLESDGCHWFFTMDRIDGVDFLTYVRPSGTLDLLRLRNSLSQLVTGVLALHAKQIIHRDLKPSNVMVTYDGRVIVLDFGLVLEADQSRSSDKMAGTPKYMAPEQAAGGKITAACDWYAVGVMIYEALTGQGPFCGGVLSILQDKQRLDAPPLPANDTTPADLAALCTRLLARDPLKRPDALEIVKAIASDVNPTEMAVTPSGHHLVGRERHLAALRDAYQTLERQREPLAAFVSGRSGEGKTALCEQFLAPLREDKRLAVMSGRCYDRESVPFKALDALIDALATYLRSLPQQDAALLMPDDIGVLVRVFPVLQRVRVVADAAGPPLTTLDEQQVRQRAFRALRFLLARIARRSLIVWFIDDLQWGDADSAATLFEVLRPPEAPAVLFLGTYRSDETADSAFLQMWREQQRQHDVHFAGCQVEVAPLTVEECVDLVIQLLGKENDNIRRRALEIAQETRGNPLLLIELVGCFDPETDSFAPMPLHEMLTKKLERLPAEAGRLLEVVAVSGQALSLEEASRTAGHDLVPVATITRMRNERLVRVIGSEERPMVDTYHDRVRETVLSSIEEGTCKGIHRELAEVIEKNAGGVAAEVMTTLENHATGTAEEGVAIPRVYDLAYHFDAAGDRRKARVYALLAAEQARRQSALEVAVNNYAIARRNEEANATAFRYRIAEGYGHALMLLGRYVEAREQLYGATDLVEDLEKKARIELLEGEIDSKEGKIDQSIVCIERALRRLGVWVPRSRFGLLYGVVRQVFTQVWHSLFPFLLHRKKPSNKLELIIYLFHRSIAAYIFQNTLKLIWAHLAGLNRAELLPPSLRLANQYAIQGMLMSMLGWHGRAARSRERALAVASKFDDDLFVTATTTNYHGHGCFASARYEEGIVRLSEATDAFVKTGDLWEVNLGHFHKGCCHFGLGDLGAAVAEARLTFGASARIGDSRVLCSSYLWARATRGDFPFEDVRSCYPSHPDDIMSTVHGIMAEGHWHSFHGRTAEALLAFEKGADQVRRSLCVNSHMIVVMPELAGALRRHADAIQAEDSIKAEQLRRRAYRLAKWAVRITRLFPAAYPLSLREWSLMLAAYGKMRKALEYADKSCAVAESQKAKYEHAQSLLVRGRLANELGLPDAEEQIRTAEAALEILERPVRAQGKNQRPA